MIYSQQTRFFEKQVQRSILLFFFSDRSVGSSASCDFCFLFTELDTYTFSQATRYHGLSVWHLVVCVWWRRKAESQPPSVALELLLWIDEPAAADGRIFCLIYVSVACRRSDHTADSSLPNAADWQASGAASSPQSEWQLENTDALRFNVSRKVDERWGEASRREPAEKDLHQDCRIVIAYSLTALNILWNLWR